MPALIVTISRMLSTDMDTWCCVATVQSQMARKICLYGSSFMLSGTKICCNDYSCVLHGVV